jgi:hypothetical protein
MFAYLGSDIELPLLPYDGSQRSIYVDRLMDVDELVYKWIDRPHVYRIGAFEGCACGFCQGAYDVKTENTDAGSASVMALRDYLRKNCATGRPIIYACWAGDESIGVKRQRQVKPSGITGTTFWFEEGDLVEFAD